MDPKSNKVFYVKLPGKIIELAEALNPNLNAKAEVVTLNCLPLFGTHLLLQQQSQKETKKNKTKGDSALLWPQLLNLKSFSSMLRDDKDEDIEEFRNELMIDIKKQNAFSKILASKLRGGD